MGRFSLFKRQNQKNDRGNDKRCKKNQPYFPQVFVGLRLLAVSIARKRFSEFAFRFVHLCLPPVLQFFLADVPDNSITHCILYLQSRAM